MHKLFRERLDEAEGRSQFIVAVIADIRGFSAFSTEHESVETAVYIKRVYMRMIDEYFPGASFYKPTGDGMLITMPYTDTKDSLREVAQGAVGGCLRCLEEFASICEGDPIINFEVPCAIGFGVAQGPACCLASGEVVLDYTGHRLNLTSRLTDLARPSGIVIDGEFGLDLLSEKQQTLFQEDHVCIRSVAEEAPRTIYIQKGVVEIPEAARRPLRLEEWETVEVKMTVREWKLAGPWYGADLQRKLKRSDGILVQMVWPKFRGGRRVRGLVDSYPAPFSYLLQANKPVVLLDVTGMLRRLAEDKVSRTAQVAVVIDYVPE